MLGYAAKFAPALQPSAIQGKEAIKLCHLATLAFPVSQVGRVDPGEGLVGVVHLTVAAVAVPAGSSDALVLGDTVRSVVDKLGDETVTDLKQNLQR